MAFYESRSFFLIFIYVLIAYVFHVLYLYNTAINIVSYVNSVLLCKKMYFVTFEIVFVLFMADSCNRSFPVNSV
jgi:hypothetical protein